MPPYRLPWRISRAEDGTHVTFVNDGGETLLGVQLSLSGPGVVPVSAPLAVVPGGQFDVRIRGRNLAESTMLILGWRRPTGEGYLWRLSF